MRPHTLAVLVLGYLAAGLVGRKIKKVVKWNALKVTYSQEGEGYYDLPWSVDEARTQGTWQKIDHDKRLNVDVYSQPEDPRLLLLFDNKGTIAGIRLAILLEDVLRKGVEEDKIIDLYEKSTKFERDNYFGKDLWHTTVLLTDDEDLAWFGGRQTPKKGKDDVVEGILLLNKYDEWTFLTTDECFLIKWWRGFEEGNCIPGLGKHYFYKAITGTDGECVHRVPFFATYDKGKLVGFGLAGYGTPSRSSTTQNYYDQDLKIENMMKDIPECVADFAEKYGWITMHVLLTKNISTITCTSPEWRVTNCDTRKSLLPFLEPFNGK